ncbi:MAG: hypothetical protein KGD60_00650 [Candidatus Thorarchaeota archaeon]|nr:hypothetical protein [Candidatus Thorarchaeota archaeon]
MKTLNFDDQHADRVIDYLSHNYSGVTRIISNTEQGVMAIFIHEECVFRTGSYQSLSVIVEFLTSSSSSNHANLNFSGTSLHPQFGSLIIEQILRDIIWNRPDHIFDARKFSLYHHTLV